MSRDGSERRSEQRLTFFSPISFAVKEQGGKIMKGVVNNVSKSGIGIYLFDPLSEGQEIMVGSTLPNAHNEYAVQWSKKLMDDFYMAGLKATD